MKTIDEQRQQFKQLLEVFVKEANAFNDGRFASKEAYAQVLKRLADDYAIRILATNYSVQIWDKPIVLERSNGIRMIPDTDTFYYLRNHFYQYHLVKIMESIAVNDTRKLTLREKDLLDSLMTIKTRGDMTGSFGFAFNNTHCLMQGQTLAVQQELAKQPIEALLGVLINGFSSGHGIDTSMPTSYQVAPKKHIDVDRSIRQKCDELDQYRTNCIHDLKKEYTLQDLIAFFKHISAYLFRIYIESYDLEKIKHAIVCQIKMRAILAETSCTETFNTLTNSLLSDGIACLHFNRDTFDAECLGIRAALAYYDQQMRPLLTPSHVTLLQVGLYGAWATTGVVGLLSWGSLFAAGNTLLFSGGLAATATFGYLGVKVSSWYGSATELVRNRAPIYNECLSAFHRAASFKLNPQTKLMQREYTPTAAERALLRINTQLSPIHLPADPQAGIRLPTNKREKPTIARSGGSSAGVSASANSSTQSLILRTAQQSPPLSRITYNGKTYTGNQLHYRAETNTYAIYAPNDDGKDLDPVEHQQMQHAFRNWKVHHVDESESKKHSRLAEQSKTQDRKFTCKLWNTCDARVFGGLVSTVPERGDTPVQLIVFDEVIRHAHTNNKPRHH